MRNALANLAAILWLKIVLSVRRFNHWRAERKRFWSHETLAWHEQQWSKHDRRPKPGKGRR